MRGLVFATCLLWVMRTSAEERLPLDLLRLQTVAIPSGGALTVRGAMRSSYDGSVLDAATTTYGDGRVETGGLLDFEAGGLHLVGQDAENHEYRFTPIGGQGPACVAAQIPSPCLLSRLLPLAQTRLLTLADFSASLSGGLSMTAPPSPELLQPQWFAGLLAALGAAALIALRTRGRVKTTLFRQALRLIARLRSRLRKGDPVHQRLLEPLAALAVGARRLEAERKRGAAEGWPGEAARAEGSLKDIIASLQALHHTLDGSTRLDRACLDPRPLAELDQGVAAATAAIQELG